MELTILRHAQSITNVVKRGNLYIPDTKEGKALQKMHPAAVPLSKLGIEQAQITGQRMAEENMQFDVVICSPLERTMQTLSIISAQYKDAGKVLAPTVSFNPLVREIDFGNVAWMTKGQAKIYFPWFKFHEGKDWFSKSELREGYFYERTPSGGESYADVYSRLQFFIIDISLSFKDRVLLITHGGTTRILRMIMENKTPRDFEQDLLLWRYRNCDLLLYHDFNFQKQYSFIR